MKINVKIDNQNYEVNIGDLKSRPIIATVDGQSFEVYPEEEVRMATPVTPAPVVQASVSAPAAAAPIPVHAAPAAASGISTVKAPIPGVIVSISVKEGDTVKKGQELIVLEAMKMKNSIRAQRDGKVIAIKVKIGDHVTQSQSMIDLGD